ncbi:MAG: bifunctional diaminohydroxyphosphoribosylaminopyrimidine deaminase/5-amino-6-(5-phosphoribosylamino)uracil reductase RibD [Hyphomicrobium sp.]|uniref:bifunctional diaminohydroxyphosphoribosylaminopyrimidine deaminase/5-amino-6-(5-phosphoribosylamino)uracil reductase RibD n=1 Tax=Hyphomicrobium sp. TaxID=82 RepID=UPI003D106B0C
MTFTPFDRHMMGIALALARRGLGTVAPNPSVGAIVADEATGELVARGMTQPGGRPHAETEALRRAGARARGATLYVTLEPCAHTGKTPPCVDAVIAAGLARVVVGIEDPDPRTQGQGVERLRAAGITVVTGLAAEEARAVTLGHILRITAGRPVVKLKMALDAAGDVPRGVHGRAVMVTGAEARAQAHLLRAEADAILVGGGTVRDDDPDLTCRLPGLAWRSPARAVVSRSLDLPDGARLFRTAREVPVWLFTGEDADGDRVSALEGAGVRIFRVPVSGGGLSLGPVLARLAEEGVTRLLVEGGAAIWRSFAALRSVDEVALFRAGTSEYAAATLAAQYTPGLDLTPTAHRRLGADTLTMFRVVDLPRVDVGRSA